MLFGGGDGRRQFFKRVGRNTREINLLQPKRAIRRGAVVDHACRDDSNDVVVLGTNHNYWFGNQNSGLAVQLNEAWTRGRLVLPSADPSVDPVLEHDLLSDPTDLARMQEGLDRAWDFLARPGFRKLMTGEPWGPRTTAEIRAQVKDVVHACSTARMGQPDDPAAVVYGWPGPFLVIASASAFVAGLLSLTTVILVPAIWRGGRRVDSWTALRKVFFTITVLVYTAFTVLLGLWGAIWPWSG